MKNPGLASAVSIAAFGMAGAVAAGPSLALAKPPLQLSGPGVRVEPLAIATARIENGKFVIGEWQEYAPAQSRGAKGYYYVFDCFGGWTEPSYQQYEYVNHAHAGLGAEPGEPRVPWDTWCVGSARWYFGSTYTCPLNVEDIESLAPGASGGSPIDAIDAAWWWGGGDCTLVFLPSDDPALCWDGDPMDHAYHGGVALSFGELPPPAEAFYRCNANGLWSTSGIHVQTPQANGSYLAALTDSGGTLNTEQGTQFMLWGTGSSWIDEFRAGRQGVYAWDDDAPIDGQFSVNECYDYSYQCPDPLGKCVGFLALRCPADLNWDGFVNADDFDLFAGWFEAPDWHRYADLTGDGFVNADDFDRFALWFDEGC
ncbi:MAG: hypothetical protein JNL50_07505 [Phycisphaerae bacterium]|nr:hypothetical protein [Phycisphaerae bacterium]